MPAPAAGAGSVGQNRPPTTVASWTPLAWRDLCACQHVVVGVPLLVPGALCLLFNGEAGPAEPRPDLPHARVVVVVAVGLLPDDLAVHHRQARPPGRPVGGAHLLLVGE